jgi:O-succinylbenzoic acid--CoA ligase
LSLAAIADRQPYPVGAEVKLGNWLARSAAAAPGRTALIAGGERVDFAELERRATGVARRLARLGVEGGDRVAILLDASGDYVVLLHALMKLGAVAVPLDPRLTSQERSARLEQIEAGLVVDDVRTIAEAREVECALLETIELDVVQCVIHTSGTQGAPKPVELTYGNHLWSAIGSGVRIGVDRADRWLCCLPLHHIGGLSIVLRSAVYGTAAVVERFDPEKVSRVIVDEQVTIASLVGTTLQRLLEVGASLDSLRCILAGGGPISPGTLERALALGAPVAPTYGLTEAASQVTTLPPGEARSRPGSAGPPILPAEVCVEEGIVLVGGPNVAPGELGPDGWLRTGDRGWIDDNGHLHPLGRADDVIVSGGENVQPEEVEQTLRAHPAVADVGVTGKDDVEWQQAVVAVVVARDGVRVRDTELREFCRNRLAPYKVPKEIRFAKRLPRDEQGKLSRKKLLD